MRVVNRPETSADLAAIRHVNRLAFGQDAEVQLVDALRQGGYVRLSLVAEEAGQIVGHILFSDLPIITEAGTVPALTLAPMAVLPELQNQGIGVTRRTSHRVESAHISYSFRQSSGLTNFFHTRRALNPYFFSLLSFRMTY